MKIKANEYYKNIDWLVFYYNDCELCRYTLAGTFPGEKESTIELLAYENNTSPENIKTRIEKE